MFLCKSIAVAALLACKDACSFLDFGFVRVCELKLEVFKVLAHPLYRCSTTYKPLHQNHPSGESWHRLHGGRLALRLSPALP